MTQVCSDEELMRKYQQGDTYAFELLYKKYKQAVYSFMLRQVFNRAICDELYQDVWMKLIHNQKSYSNKGSFKAYLFQISRNRLIDFYRSDKSAQLDLAIDVDALIDDSNTNSEEQLDQDRRLKKIQLLLQELPQAQREAFLLKEQAGLSLAEIAEITSENIETVKSRLRYAFAKIRQGVKHD